MHTHKYSCLWPTSSCLHVYVCFLILLSLPARGAGIMGNTLLLSWPRLTLSLSFAFLSSPLSSFVLCGSKQPSLLVLFRIFVMQLPLRQAVKKYRLVSHDIVYICVNALCVCYVIFSYLILSYMFYVHKSLLLACIVKLCLFKHSRARRCEGTQFGALVLREKFYFCMHLTHAQKPLVCISSLCY